MLTLSVRGNWILCRFWRDCSGLDGFPLADANGSAQLPVLYGPWTTLAGINARWSSIGVTCQYQAMYETGISIQYCTIGMFSITGSLAYVEAKPTAVCVEVMH